MARMEILERGLKLLPFSVAVALYFSTLPQPPSLLASLLKVLPIISLEFFIILNGFGAGKGEFFCKMISVGLLFSMVGDVFLIWDQYFIFGMAGFAVAHMFFIAAFGWYPLQLSVGLVLYFFATLMTILLLPGLESSLILAVPVYVFLLTTTAWRAMACVRDAPQEWMRVNMILAGILWLCSDGILGFNQFRAPIPHSKLWIMGTYYAAQLCITLTTLRKFPEYSTTQSTAASPQAPNDETQANVDKSGQKKMKK